MAFISSFPMDYSLISEDNYLNMNYIEDFQLKDITTLHLPVQCHYFAEYESIDELKSLLCSDLAKSNKVFQIGGGSNLLFTHDFDGLILHSKIKFIRTVFEDDSCSVIEAGAGVIWDEFVKHCIAHDLYGSENMSYIPGEVGASAVQNIGSYGGEVKDIIYKVHCIEKSSLKSVTFLNEDCHYGYRDSIFKNELKDKYVVTSVEYRLSKLPCFRLDYGPLRRLQESSEPITLQNVRDTIIDVRKSKLPDPKEIGSVGSFFKNPVISKADFDALLSKYPDAPHYPAADGMIKVPAGWLIENAGLKGHRIGNAQVYEKQCLVIVNVGGASSSNIVNLYTHVISTVKEKYGIELHPEANII